MQDVPKGCMMLRKGRTGPPIVSASVDCSLLPLSHLQASTLPALQLIDDALAAHPGLAQTLRKGIWRSTSSSLQGADGHSQAVAPGAAASSSSGSAGGARQGTGPAASDQAAVQSAGENCGQATAAAIEKAAQGNGLEAAAVLQQVLEIAFSWLAFEMQVRASTHLIRRPANGLFWLLGACLVAAPGCQPCAQLAGVISKRIESKAGTGHCASWVLPQRSWKLHVQNCVQILYSLHTYYLACKDLLSSLDSRGRVPGRLLAPLQSPAGPEAAADLPPQGGHLLESCTPSTKADMTSPSALQEQDGCGRFVAYLAMTVLTLFELPALQQPYPDCAVLTSVVPAVMRATKRIAAGQCKHTPSKPALHKPAMLVLGCHQGRVRLYSAASLAAHW